MNTYAQLDAFLGTRAQRTVPGIRSTVVVRRGTSIAVCYHNTDVVTHHVDSSFNVNSGGFRTATTKSRINAFSTARVYQKNFEWFVADGIPFVEGIVVGPTGCTTLEYMTA